MGMLVANPPDVHIQFQFDQTVPIHLTVFHGVRDLVLAAAARHYVMSTFVCWSFYSRMNSKRHRISFELTGQNSQSRIFSTRSKFILEMYKNS